MPADYVRAVVRAGGVPLLVPPGADGRGDARRVDGLVFSGGSDLDPALYGAEAHPETTGVVPRAGRLRARADAGRARARHADARDLPRLAGAERRARRRPRAARPGPRRARRAQADAGRLRRPRRRRSSPGTRLSSLVGDRARREVAPPPGLRRARQGLREAARAPDGTVEALEDPARRFTLGVLWHPEAGEDLALFEALVAEARAYRRTRQRLAPSDERRPAQSRRQTT